MEQERNNKVFDRGGGNRSKNINYTHGHSVISSERGSFQRSTFKALTTMTFIFSNSLLSHLSGTVFVISCGTEKSHWRFYERAAQSPLLIVVAATICDWGAFTVWKRADKTVHKNCCMESGYLYVIMGCKVSMTRRSMHEMYNKGQDRNPNAMLSHNCLLDSMQMALHCNLKLGMIPSQRLKFNNLICACVFIWKSRL